MSTFGTDGTVRQQGVPDSMFGNFQLSGIYCSKSAYNAFFNLVDQACAEYANLEIWGTPTMENNLTTADRLAKRAFLTQLAASYVSRPKKQSSI